MAQATRVLGRPLDRQQLKIVQTRLLSTWQTSAAIAQHCGLPARTVLAALKRYEREWGLQMRIDGHNQVHLWRRRQRLLVMGVSFPLPGDNDEEVEG
jgi:hypothetical protein